MLIINFLTLTLVIVSNGAFDCVPRLSGKACEVKVFKADYFYPAFGDCSIKKKIVGFEENMFTKSYQFRMIFNDGTKTEC